MNGGQQLRQRHIALVIQTPNTMLWGVTLNSDARFNRLLPLLTMCMVAYLSAFANDPRVAPADHKEWSPNHAFFLEAKMKEKRTRVFRAGRFPQMLWEIPAYLQIADLSNDGKHVAFSYAGGNILDPGVRAVDTLVTFYSADGTSRAVSVADILPEFCALGAFHRGTALGSGHGLSTHRAAASYLG